MYTSLYYLLSPHYLLSLHYVGIDRVRYTYNNCTILRSMFFIPDYSTKNAYETVTCIFDNVYTKNQISLHGPNIDITIEDKEGKTYLKYNKIFVKEYTNRKNCVMKVCQNYHILVIKPSQYYLW